MKILVDADACPVKQVIEKVAKEFQIDVIMLIDTSHILESDYSKVITVSQGKDAVDIELINLTEGGDIVITGDYGVATMVLGKKAFPINQNGRVYTDDNIDLLMFERHLYRIQRGSGKRGGKIKKRTREDDERFEASFRKLCKEVQ